VRGILEKKPQPLEKHLINFVIYFSLFAGMIHINQTQMRTID